MFSSGKLSVDIVDYPGEWLLDLPLLGKDFRGFSADAIELAELPVRTDLSAEWREAAAAVDPMAPFDEMAARRLAELFTAYLRACKADHRALSTLPPGRVGCAVGLAHRWCRPPVAWDILTCCSAPWCAPDHASGVGCPCQVVGPDRSPPPARARCARQAAVPAGQPRLSGGPERRISWLLAPA